MLGLTVAVPVLGLTVAVPVLGLTVSLQARSLQFRVPLYSSFQCGAAIKVAWLNNLGGWGSVLFISAETAKRPLIGTGTPEIKG